jgi:E3 ubiquitin-protein ligase TRIP12
MRDALKELRTVLVESDISSFEINHSGLIAALLGFLVDESGYTSGREQRLRSFINTFADCPVCIEVPVF